MPLSDAYADFLAVLSPAALGATAMIYSNIHCLGIMNKPRYALKGFEHPYKPWTDAHNDEKSYRGYKASMNQVEWLVYSVPLYTFAVAFSPALPKVGHIGPWLCLPLALLYAKGNVDYMKGYMLSAKDRMPGFKLRTLTVRLMLGMLLGGVGCFLLQRNKIVTLN
eukprot:CAMPEP_0114510284 /NCGR_PEP_ID=MMETSP0109-20121206/13695_1 /TAXON_ID=29199 /ORGANISM="Chlorarachnion reptans, Strain CCCM449" /LENGTH=164 /DNA_ID=CAMNT_0001689561 /DNA_START=25 /DNA_END=519 /DNA_ORIENTATION=-